MQTTIYYSEDDQFIIDQVERKARNERKSKSAVILSILERYFESDKRIGRILRDLGQLSESELRQSLELQAKDKSDKLLGEILVDKDFIKEADLERALAIQGKTPL